MRVTLKILKRLVFTVASIIVLLIGLYFIITTPKVLTSLVNSYAPDYLNANIEVERVEIKILSSWPNIELSLDNTTVVSKAYGAPSSDTLISFAALTASLNIKSLLDSSIIELNSARLNSARISATINKQGKGSWEIYDTTPTPNDTTTSNYTFKIGTIKVEGDNRVVFKDEQNATELKGALREIGITQTTPNTYATSLDIALEYFKIDTTDLKSLLPLTIKGATEVNLATFALNNTDIKAEFAGVIAQLKGDAQLKDSLLVSTLKIDFTNIQLDKSIDLIEEYTNSPKIKRIESDLSFNIEIAASGGLDYKNAPKGVLPTLTIAVKSNGGGVRFKETNESIDKFFIDLKAYFNIEDNSKNYINLRELNIESNWINLHGKAMIRRYLETSRVEINTHIQSTIDLGVSNTLTSAVAQNLIHFGKLQHRGKLSLDMMVHANAEDLSLARIGFTKIDTKIGFTDVEIKNDSLTTFLDGSLEATTKNRTLLLNCKFDSLYINAVSLKIDAKGRNVVISAGITSRDSTYAKSGSIPPLGGKINAKQLSFNEFASADTLKFRLRNSSIRFEMGPDSTDVTRPIFKLNLNSNRLSYINGLNRFRLGNSEIGITASLMKTDAQIAVLKEQLINSLQLRYPNIERDSLLAHSAKFNPRKRTKAESEQHNLDLNPGRDIRSILRRWKTKGHITSNSARITTPYFPLPTKISKVDINFNMDSLIINSLEGEAGRSHLKLSGEVTDIKNSLLGQKPLSVKIALESDLIYFNELIIAVNSGDKTASNLANITTEGYSDENYEEIVAQATDTTNSSMLVMIPSNINIDASLLIKKAYYGELEMSKLTAKATSRKKILQISELSATTNIGKLKLYALYATPTIDSIYSDTEIELQEVDLKRLVSQVPQIDSLLPMLSSFEGIVSIKAATRTRLDSTMTIIMPSLQAVASISGHDLVLLDGETFTEISKMLKFKNKKRNLIDKISAELKIENSKVELFPCIIEIDRYRAAASGVHSLDMSFKYHISVLKSIIPFRFGVDIFGNLDDWKFRIVSAKYKSEKSIASRSYEIDNFRINLREEIKNIFKDENKMIIDNWNTLDSLTQNSLTNDSPTEDSLTTNDLDRLIVIDSTDMTTTWESTKVVLTKDGYKAQSAQ